MGNRKQKWTAEEEATLKAGVAKHGIGKWKNVLVDADFAATLANRLNVDLQVLQCYKIKDSRLSTKPSTTAHTDARQGQIPHPRLIAPFETVERAAETAAQWIAEAENKTFVAAEAFKEAERILHMADDTDAMVALCKEFLGQCTSSGFSS